MFGLKKKNNRSRRTGKRKQHIQKNIDVLIIKKIELEIEIEKIEKKIEKEKEDLKHLIEREG